MSAGGLNGITSPTGGGLFQPTPIRETAGHSWPLRDGTGFGASFGGTGGIGSGSVPEDRMNVDVKMEGGQNVKLGGEGDMVEQERVQREQEQEEERKKRKVISPTEGWDDRMKRGNWATER